MRTIGSHENFFSQSSIANPIVAPIMSPKG